MLVAVGPDLRYLTAYEAMPLERLTMLVVIPGHAPTIVVPRLERGAAEAGLRTDVTIVTWNEVRDPYDVVTGLLLRPDRTRGTKDRRLRHALGQPSAATAGGPSCGPVRARVAGPGGPADDQGPR